MIQSRRAVVIISSQDRNVVPFPGANSQHLRSLFIRPFGGIERPFDTRCIESPKLSLEAVYQNFRLLRVLILQGSITSSETLPEGVGSLIHLRYLGLRDTNIKELPSSIGNLRNLLTLDWRGNSFRITGGKIRIPDVLWKLEGLTYLNLCYEIFAEVKALKLHTLKRLQTLKVSVYGGNWMVEELPCLSPTIQKLTILAIGSQELLEAAFRCPSIRDDRLRSLRLGWSDQIALENVEEPISHCQRLRKLRLYGRMAGDGLNIQFPASIKHLDLSGTRFAAESALEALGKLPHLLYMSLTIKAYVGKRWTCRAGEFPQLKKLYVGDLGNWEEWSIERGAMPRLARLSIQRCKKLRKLPGGLKSITSLLLLEIMGMDDEFTKRIKAGGEDAHIIQHVPFVWLS